MATRILMSCVAEDREPYYTRVAMLARTARAFGGALGNCPLLASFVGQIDPERQRELEDAGAQVRVVAAHPDGAHSNKLRAFEVTESEDFDVLLYLDCDVAVAGDPTPLLRTDAVGVVPAEACVFDEDDWQGLFARFALRAPSRTVRLGKSGRDSHPYFNSGVIAVPRDLLAPFLGAWAGALVELRSYWQQQPPKRYRRYYADQAALAMTLCGETPWYELDHGANFPTGLRLDPAVAATVSRPMLLHYQRNVDRDGFLLRPREARAEEAAERVNRLCAEASGRRYRGFRDPGLSRRLARKTRYRVQVLRDAVS
jgi:hypothetical protein